MVKAFRFPALDETTIAALQQQYNHQRETWLEVQADIAQHFALLRQRPGEVLCHLGSAFAEEWPRP